MKRPFIVPEDTRHEQSRASDPRHSAWVSANAGSGKTHVLAQRVIRLLLDGVDPSKILCLTYTRAAASNMANRIFETLGQWTRLDDRALADAIAELDGTLPSQATLREARRLFARALETPGGLKIQTIHAFCEAVLHQFPLEANIAGHFQLLEGPTEAALMAEARRYMITGAVAGDDGELAEAFAQVLSIGQEFGLDALLGEIVRNRDGLRQFIDQIGGSTPRFLEIFEEFDFARTDTEASIAAGAWPLPAFSPPDMRNFLREAERKSAGNALKYIAPDLVLALEESDPLVRLERLSGSLLKGDGEPYNPTWVFAKPLRDALPDLVDQYLAAVEALKRAAGRLALFRLLQASRAALVVADWLIGRYEQLKAARGFLDFNDLIQRTIRLLSRADAGAWVQYKLDRGIDHILIDEAQDTSPEQWVVVKKLAEEFFAGFGSREDVNRTLFAVGDEKQSIYSFQGARPEEFALNGWEFMGRAEAIDRAFARGRLVRSFRSTADVLSAVDLVFAGEKVREGMTRDPEPIVHEAIRKGAPGYVELWPTLGETVIDEPEDWRQPIDHASAPAVRIADAIAATIAGWIGKGEIIEATGRRLSAGDVMVLVRKRGSFVHALSRSLKNRHVAVAGADRLRLQDHIAVKDLMALGRFVLQPDDDLSLAALLRSPVFNLSEEKLFELAAHRGKDESLFARLCRTTEEATFGEIADRLRKWRDEADFKPVFEFYATVLARDGIRRRMVARLGHEAGEILDEFLNFCLASETVGIPGLEAFLATLETAGPEIRREMDQTRDEVRIMTVHAAKGLEAPVVFLVDDGSASFSASHLPRLMPFEPRGNGWLGDGYLWRAGTGTSTPFLKQLEAQAAVKAAQEYRRLLYVGMTRAEDRLLICGYYRKRPPDGMSWHSIVRDAFSSADCSEHPAPFEADRPVYRYRVTPVAALPDEQQEDHSAGFSSPPMPANLKRSLPPAPRLPRPLAPSGASLLIEEDEMPAAASSPILLSPRPSLALERGTAVHRLLQVLPDIDGTRREAMARRYLSRMGSNWTEAEREEAWHAVARILDDEHYSRFFAHGSRAEVAIMGTLTVRGKERAVSGKIDRLAISDEEVLILDYKSGRVRSAADAPEAYVLQMALYRALLQPLYPEKAIRAVLLFTGGPELLFLPEASMDDALARLTLA